MFFRRKLPKDTLEALRQSYLHWASNTLQAQKIDQLLPMSGRDCALCQHHQQVCTACPLETAGLRCNHHNSPYRGVLNATNEFELAEAAAHMRDVLFALYLKNL